MSKIRIIFNRVDADKEDKVVIKDEVVDSFDDDVIDENVLACNLKTIFSILLKLRSEDIQTGWNINLKIGESPDDPKINIHAYGSNIGTMVTHIRGVGSRRDLGTIPYTNINQMIEEFENMCSKEMREKMILNKMDPSEFRDSILEMEVSRNNYVKSKKNPTPNMIYRSDRILNVIREHLTQ